MVTTIILFKNLLRLTWKNPGSLSHEVLLYFKQQMKKKTDRKKRKKRKEKDKKRYIARYFQKILTLIAVALMIFTNNLGCLILNQFPLMSFLSKPVFQFSDLTLKDKYMQTQIITDDNHHKF